MMSPPAKSFILIIVISLLAGCTAAVPKRPSAEVSVPLADPYDERLRQQGYAQLVFDPLQAAIIPADPSQADLGAEMYRQVCMACHGDWGQGLTDEWRGTWGEDGNCWQSRCHAPNHPDQGFQLPHTIPAVTSLGALARYDTAAELQQNIVETMPWWNPGTVSEADSWALTAFLMRTRGELGDDVTLDKGNAPIYRLHHAYVSPPDARPGIITLLLLLLLATVIRVGGRRG